MEDSISSLLAFLNKPTPTLLDDLPAPLRCPGLLTEVSMQGFLEQGSLNSGRINGRLFVVEGNVWYSRCTDFDRWGRILEHVPEDARLAVHVRLTPDGRLAAWKASKASQPSPPSPEADAEAMVNRVALAGSPQIMLLADRKGRSANDRMRDIAAVDVRFKGLDGPKWATLLKVRPPAIYQTEAWQEWHPREE